MNVPVANNLRTYDISHKNRGEHNNESLVPKTYFFWLIINLALT